MIAIIYKYIVPGNLQDSKHYASSKYYGNKLIFKSEDNNIYVATIPSKKTTLEPKKKDFFNLDIILNNIATLKCDLYYNSLFPVVMVNKLVSLADHPSSDMLRALAREKIK